MKSVLKSRYGLIVALLVVMIWSETFVSSKILLDAGLMPADIFFVRFTLAYILSWLLSPKRFFADNWCDEGWMALLGLTGGSFYFMAENSALSFSTASNVAIIVCSAPVITAVMISAFTEDERMNLRQIIGSFIAFAGVILIIFNGEVLLRLNPVGDALALGAALLWGFYSLIMKKVSGHYQTAFITRKVFFYGIISIIPYFIFVHPAEFDMAILARPVIWGNLLYLGIVASMFCFIAWNWCLKTIGTVRTTNLIYCQPFFTMVFAAIILSERITWMAILGTVVLTVGMILANDTTK